MTQYSRGARLGESDEVVLTGGQGWVWGESNRESRIALRAQLHGMLISVFDRSFFT